MGVVATLQGGTGASVAPLAVAQDSQDVEEQVDDVCRGPGQASSLVNRCQRAALVLYRRCAGARAGPTLPLSTSSQYRPGGEGGQEADLGAAWREPSPR